MDAPGERAGGRSSGALRWSSFTWPMVTTASARAAPIAAALRPSIR